MLFDFSKRDTSRKNTAMFPSVKLVKTDKVNTFSEGLCTRTVLETHDFAVAVLVDGYCNTGYEISSSGIQNAI